MNTCYEARSCNKLTRSESESESESGKLKPIFITCSPAFVIQADGSVRSLPASTSDFSRHYQSLVNFPHNIISLANGYDVNSML
jgi:hypothetical protein